MSDSPRLDAELLLASAARLGRSELLLKAREPVEAPGFEALLARRLNHEPIPYILGTWEFYSLEFICRAPVLVPRPETEHLVEVALEHLAGRTAPQVLDLCTGTGCVAVSIATHCPGASVHAVDLQPHAVALARENVAHHSAKVTVYQGDLFEALPAGCGPFEVIVSNPPYVSEDEYRSLSDVIRKHEDPVALVAGDDGLKIIQRILADARQRVVPGGLLGLEIGETQADAVCAMARELGWADIKIRHDLAGHPRIFTAMPARDSGERGLAMRH